MRFMKVLSILLAPFIFTFTASAEVSPASTLNLNVNESQDVGNTGTTAAAESVMNMFDNTKLEKLLFNFGRAQVRLLPQGDWNIKGKVTHTRILCATYQMGVRFGVGQAGCNNVTWISDFEYGTNVKQCNSTTLEHKGGGFVDINASGINKVTCAELDVRCFGSGCTKE